MIHYLYHLDYPAVESHIKANTVGNQAPLPTLSVINGATQEANPANNGNIPSPKIMDYSMEKEHIIDTTSKAADTIDESMLKLSKKSKKKKRNTITELEPAPQLEPSLTLHACMYSLGSKYAIEGLKSLSAGKFEKEIRQHWETEDFLKAAHEVYTATDRSDRTLRDAVLNAIKSHPELLERSRVQDVIRGLELSFDLLMHMRTSTSSSTPAA
jgi:hypothetical protein